MKENKQKKHFRDPIYGFITLDKVERNIVDTRPFQRLRKIKQLGMSYLVYPSAHHTRFEHSLGVLHASTEMYNSIVNEPENTKILGWNKRNVKINLKLLRLASLLHDIGHPPFSHASEDLFPESQNHESYTYKIIVNSEIGRLIDKNLGGDYSTKIAEIATQKSKDRDGILLQQILTGEIGTDRVDYLARDSYNLGVPYGNFDYDRLLRILHLREKDGNIHVAVNEGGTHIIEAFLLARYFMFLQVYFHKTTRILNYHLSEFLKESLPISKYPERIDDFLKLDDCYVLNKIENSSPKSAKRLMGRDHFRMVHETDDHPPPEHVERFDWLESNLINKFNKKIVVIDKAERDPTNYEQPTIFIRDGDSYKSIIDASTLISSLKTIRKMRIYAEPKKRAEIKKYCKEFWNKREESGKK